MGNGLGLSSVAYPLIILWMVRCAKRYLDVIRVSKILSNAFPVLVAPLICDCAGCVDMPSPLICTAACSLNIIIKYGSLHPMKMRSSFPLTGE